MFSATKRLPTSIPQIDPEDYEDTDIPFGPGGTVTSSNEDQPIGVSFAAWLARDPKVWKGSPRYMKDMYWERHFYPSLDMILNDLHAKWHLPAGEYVIHIDW